MTFSQVDRGAAATNTIAADKEARLLGEPRQRPTAESQQSTDRRALWWCALGVALVAIAVRIPGAINFSFWEDEVASAHVLIEPTYSAMISAIVRHEAMPPLWYMVGWLGVKAGLTPHAYRGLSVLAGGIMAGGTVVVARRCVPLWAATFAGLVVALGWRYISHGYELRAYEAFAAAAVVFAEVLLRALERGPRSRAMWLWLPLVVAVGSMTNYFFLLSLLAGVLWVWLEPSTRRRAVSVTAASVIGLIPLFVWTPDLISQYTGDKFAWIGPFSLSRVIQLYWGQLTLLSGHGHLLAPILLLVCVLAGAVLLARRSGAGRMFALLALLPVVLAAIAWLAGSEVFDVRNLLATGPFAAIALAALLCALPVRAGQLLAVAACAAIIAWPTADALRGPTPYNQFARVLEEHHWNSSDPIVLLTGPRPYRTNGPLEWYLPDHDLLFAQPLAPGSVCQAIFVIAFRADATAVEQSPQVSSEEVFGNYVVAELKGHTIPTQAPFTGVEPYIAKLADAHPCASPSAHS